MTHIRTRRDTAADWVTANPVLRLGELGIETDSPRIKAGDGVTAWNSLPYLYDGASIQAALASKADLNSPALTGNPTAPTPLTSDNDTSIATTAYVKNNLVSYAPLASPTFTGDPKAPTPAVADNDTSIATTKFVKDVLGASPALAGNPTAPTPATSDNDTSIATTAFVKAQAYATLASPTFTGDPKAPTPTTSDNDTSIATTAFVVAKLADVNTPQTMVTCSAATTVSTATDIAGLSVTVTSPGPSAVYEVSLSLDVERITTVTAGSTFIGTLVVNGVTQTQQMVYFPGNNLFRAPVCKTYLITGLAAGSRIIKAQGATTSGAEYRVNNLHSTMIVKRIA